MLTGHRDHDIAELNRLADYEDGMVIKYRANNIPILEQRARECAAKYRKMAASL